MKILISDSQKTYQKNIFLKTLFARISGFVTFVCFEFWASILKFNISLFFLTNLKRFRSCMSKLIVEITLKTCELENDWQCQTIWRSPNAFLILIEREDRQKFRKSEIRILTIYIPARNLQIMESLWHKYIATFLFPLSLNQRENKEYSLFFYFMWDVVKWEYSVITEIVCGIFKILINAFWIVNH